MEAVRWSLVLGAALAVLGAGCGRSDDAGTIAGDRIPAAVVSQRAQERARAAAEVAAAARLSPPEKQILFGDLHVHSTFSADAFMMSLPILQGEGAHPVADACDFARFCSGVDFWSINDHAEGITPRRWRETKESIRRCNEIAGDPANPDVVAFLGWEWTQVGTTPENHWGHKNVIFRDLEESAVPARPIDSDSYTNAAMRTGLPLAQRVGLPLLDFPNRQRYFDLSTFLAEIRDTERCPAGVDVRELPEDCMEGAATPEILFEKLAQWDLESMVIPHGTTWGTYTPAGSSWDKQLTPAQHDPEQQRLIEVFSGHGNSEEYADFKSVEVRPPGTLRCPAPTAEFEPCCWRAGEIIRSRCEDPASAECERRVGTARIAFLRAGVGGRHVVPGTTLEDWKDCGECRDCFLPAMKYRPRGSAQYILSLSGFDTPGEPQRFEFGFIGSSDSHTSRPGTGYKEFGRLFHTEARGPRDADWYQRVNEPPEPGPEPVAFDPYATDMPAYRVVDFERQASFFLTGGLAVVHAENRSREAVWQALERREVYATSGERILLWFDLLNAPDGPLPMGRRARLAGNPRFRVRAVGSFVQEPGCPEVSTGGLSPERLEFLCRGECYNPGDARHPIDRIEVVRVRPQVVPGEPMGSRVEDPWRVFPCPPDPDGCVIEFEDPEFAGTTRPHTYYVRAIQPPTPIVNGGLSRCRYDEDGACIEARPCHGGYQTDPEDDCLAPGEERAWSSPIFLDAL